MMGVALLGAVLASGSVGHASALFVDPNGPWTMGRGHGVAALASRWAVGVGDAGELSGNGLATFVAPSLQWKQTLASGDDGVALGLIAGVSVPTYGLRLTQGLVLPSAPEMPFAAVARLGPTIGARNDRWSAALAVLGAVGFANGDVPDSDMPWLSPQLTPLHEGWAVYSRLSVGFTPSDRWALTGDWRLAVPRGPDQYLRVRGLRALGDRWAVGAGVAWAQETYGFGVRPGSVPLLEVTPLIDLQARW